MDETATEKKRRSMYSLKETGGGKRRIKRGAYSKPTYVSDMPVHAATAKNFDTAADDSASISLSIK